MSKDKTTSELISHKEKALYSIESYIDSLINSTDKKERSKADKLSYWLEDYMRFLNYETTAKNKKWHKYKRGQIIKVHLGYNIGSEEGGLHYAVVINVVNHNSNNVLTIVPLTSVKKTTDLNNLKDGCLYLGNELFTSLITKHSTIYNHFSTEHNRLQSLINDALHGVPIEFEDINNQLSIVESKLNALNRIKGEILKMKSGSIALVNQITTVSKIRIYDPKENNDILHGVKLSNEKLNLIDDEIKRMFTK